MPDLIAGGRRIHYAAAPVFPRRPVIVFLHGAGANHTIWLGQMKALRAQAWVVIPDLPGHGRSEEIPGLTIEEYAEALIPFLESIASAVSEFPAAAELSSPASNLSAVVSKLPSITPELPSAASELPSPNGDRRAVLAGHSMGGGIALLVAARRPDLLAGLVLVGTGAKLAVSAEILDGLETAPIETQALVARSQFTPGADPALILRTIRDLAGTPVRRTLADFRACNAFDVRESITSISLPALVLCGRDDRMTPPRYSEYLAQRMPHATLSIIEGTGHAIMIEQPEKVSSAIAEFVESIQ